MFSSVWSSPDAAAVEDDILLNSYAGELSALILLVCSAAFSIIDHEILTQCLEMYASLSKAASDDLGLTCP